MGIWSGIRTTLSSGGPLPDRGHITAAAPSRRFPDQPDFVGRLLRLAFTHMANELYALVSVRWPQVTPAQSTVMILLDREGTRVGDLAVRAQVNKQSMSEMVIALEKQGLVERRPDPADGRARLVVPTAEGWEAMRAGLEAALAIHGRWEALIGAEKMDQLMALLRELVERLED